VDRKQDRSLAAKSQTNVVWRVSPDSFGKRRLGSSRPSSLL